MPSGDDPFAAPRQIGAVGYGAVTRAIGEGAAMQPHHDWPRAAVAEAGCPQVQGQAGMPLSSEPRNFPETVSTIGPMPVAAAEMSLAMVLALRASD